ncbi:hypothetical protein AAG906_016211 [Vitis piasezkii]
MTLEYSSSYSLLPRLIITPCFFIFLLFLLCSISSFHVTFTFASTPITSFSKVEQDQEALALLTWKASLDNQTQSFLFSWSGRNSCHHWFGVTCHRSGSVSGLDLQSCGLRGTLHNLNFHHFPTSLLLIFITTPSMEPFQSTLLGSNNLTGPIPSFVGNLRNLTILYLAQNDLSGYIPQEIGLLRSLNILDLSFNNLSGSIPASIGNLSSLTTLALHHNKLSGAIPPEMNNITHLKSLQMAENNFIGHLPQEICLGNALEKVSAQMNHFTGPIPKSLKNCTSLVRVRLEKNQLTGDIAESFGVYPNLNYIDLSNNNFYGELSEKWGECHMLTNLNISNNKISGAIPPQLGKAIQLQQLDLSSNHLIGKIPKELGMLPLLFKLLLGNNKLSGSIPLELGNLSDLEILDLASNNFSGPIPKQLGNFWKLWSLNLSENRFVDSIPDEIGKMHHLQTLDLSQNMLTGEMPPPLGELQNLETLNLSHNGLSGTIPHTFDDLRSLTVADISYNQLEGPLPNIKAFAPFEAFKNNKGLCGNNVTHLKPCSASRKKANKFSILIIILLIVSSLLFLFAFVIGIFSFPKIEEEKNQVSRSRWDRQFQFKQCIGTGGYGTVYKAELPTDKASQYRQALWLQFICRELILVYENDEEAEKLDWIVRLNVVKGVAKALSYMHHDCSPPIIHRDISSNNVLLDSEYEAHVSDFGTARLLKSDSSNWTSFAGTFGYTAPEQSMIYLLCRTCILNEELISSLLSSSSSSSTSPSTADHFLLNDVIDQRPSPPVNQVAKEVEVAVKLAFACLRVNPQSRPTMQQVARALSTQWPPLSKPFSMITLLELQDHVRRFIRSEEVSADKTYCYDIHGVYYREETHSVPVEMTEGKCDGCRGGAWECQMTVSLLLRLPNNLHHRMLGQVDFINGGTSMPGLISFCSGFSGMNPFNQSNWSKVQCEMILAFLSFADYFQPRFFLLEHVRNFMSFNKGQAFRQTLEGHSTMDWNPIALANSRFRPLESLVLVLSILQVCNGIESKFTSGNAENITGHRFERILGAAEVQEGK